MPSLEIALATICALLGMFCSSKMKDFPLLQVDGGDPDAFPPVRPLKNVRGDLTRDVVIDHLMYGSLAGWFFGAAAMAVLLWASQS
jgi:hypothetical protein